MTMRILFLTISYSEKKRISFYEELLQEFVGHGHEVYVACAAERRQGRKTGLETERGIQVLRIKTGNITGAISVLEKGISTISIDFIFKRAIKKYFHNQKFDLLMYPTPPITLGNTVFYLKKKMGAATYLLLKDIFPQNAVDLGMMEKTGPKSVIYHFFRNKEKKLYRYSDFIGCMSKANVAYLLTHNPEIVSARVEVCPNSVKVKPKPQKQPGKKAMLKKYGIHDDRTIFIYGGNLGKPQGITSMLACMKKCSDMDNIYFLIAGDGTEAGKIKRFIQEEKKDYVKYVGMLAKEEYQALAEACDVGLIFLESCFTIPNFPSRMLSYMQSAMPVLAATDPNTDIGDVIAQGGFGWACRSDQPDEFRKYIKAASESDLESMGDKGYRYLTEHYDVGTSYEIIMGHFRKGE